MTNTNKILGGLLIAALIYIALMEGCNNRWSKPEIVRVDTVRNEITTDTIVIINTDTVIKYISINVPVPYLDTTYVPKTVTVVNFDDFTIERPWIYQDTITDDTMSINYWIRSLGYIDSISIGYRPLAQYYIETKSVLELEVTKQKRFNGIYGGFDVGVSKLGIVHFSPTIEASGQRFSVNIGYDVYDKAFIGGVKTRIRLKRD